MVAEQKEVMNRGQAERLVPMLNDVLREGGLSIRHLDAIAVGVGPGNFTGLRISVATARGLALSLGKPAIGVSTFEQQFAEGSDAVIVAAPRERFFVQLFRGSNAHGEAHIGTRAEVLPKLNGVRMISGDGASMIADDLNATVLPKEDDNPAIKVALRGAARFQEGPPFSRPSPLYIRPADAAPPRHASPEIIP